VDEPHVISVPMHLVLKLALSMTIVVGSVRALGARAVMNAKSRCNEIFTKSTV